MDNDTLFQEIDLGALHLKNRVIMAPMTRARSHQPGDVPWELNAEYYRQRASAGLIITEATQVSPQGKGYPFTPGIYNDEQVAGWKKVTDAVHEAGGTIIAQLWHVGRISHTSLQPAGGQPVAPSAIRPKVKNYVGPEVGLVDLETPRALETTELPGIVDDFRRAAENAKRAGFDGVQLHGANGYLIDQFLRSGTNQRTDPYGGTVHNRIGFPLRVVDAIVDVWGGSRVSVRISPFGAFNDMHDDNPQETFTVFTKELNRFHLAFLEVVHMSGDDTTEDQRESMNKALRDVFAGPIVLNGDFTAERARDTIAAGKAAAISFGRPFISNPDLPERFRTGAALTEGDQETFYGGDAHGYTDYPALDTHDAVA